MTLSSAITSLKNAINSLVTNHSNVTSSSTTKGHSKAGGAPQAIGDSLSAGTDNGYYARADHVHTAQTNHIKDSNAYSNLGTSANTTQAEINSAINNKIGDAITYINQ